MGAVLSIENDHADDMEIIKANIFTPGQGICLQRLQPKKHRRFRFDQNLAYGSWYDIQLQVPSKADEAGGEESVRYLIKGVYLRHGRTIKISKLTEEKNRDLGAEWHCGSCKKRNVGSLATCEFCFANKSQTIIEVLSYIPFVGVPFSITNAVLQCGKAAQSNTTDDKIDAGLSVAFAVLDTVTAPFIVGALVKIPGKVAAQTGIKLTAKTVFCEAGKPLVKAVGKELGKGGVITAVKVGKAAFGKIVKKSI